MGNFKQNEINLLVQLLWDSIENAERIVGCEKSLGITSKDWALKEIEMQKEVLEKLIVIEKQFQKRR